MVVDREDLKTAYDWFTHPNENHESHISPYGSHILREIRSALSSHSLEEARRMSRDLHFNPDKNSLECGEILVRVATYAMYLGETEHLEFAKEQIQNAVANFPDGEPHYRAITLWFLGFIYWGLPHHQRKAIQQWEYCLRVLNDLSYSSASLNPGWYQKIRFQIIESVFRTRMLNRYFALKDVEHLKIVSFTKPSLPVRTRSAAKPKPGRRSPIRSLPVYQYVPAGGWGVVEPEEVGKSEIDHFVIDDLPYYGVDLVGRGHINIQETEQYAIVRIKGESMNNFDILNDNYVLIHRQDDANHKDIVLAAREDIDTEATLKILIKQGRRIELHPHSSALNPETGRPFEKLEIPEDTSVKILGVAIAVLKPFE